MMMRSMGLGVVAAALSFSCVASDDSESREMAMVYRGGGNFPMPPNYPGNFDIEIYEGSSTSSSDCLIYDFVGPNVHDGATGDLVVVVVNDTIQAPDGTTLCTVEGDMLVDRVRTGGADGPVLFTTFGRWVFEGDIDFEGDSIHQVAEELADQLLFTFQGPHIYEGAHPGGELVATSTKPLTHANTTRKLVVTAMLTGECGGNGIPESMY
jgi:hypothetical protein